MKFLKYILLLVFILGLLREINFFAQDTTYTAEFKNFPDTTQIRILTEISDTCDEASILNYVDRALIIGKRIYDENPQAKYVLYYASAYNNQGYYYDKVGKVDEAINSYLKALEIREATKDSVAIAESYVNLAYMFQHQNDIDLSIQYYNKSKTIFEHFNDTAGILNVYINLGYVYYEQKKYELAQLSFEKGLYFSQKTNNITALGYAYNNLAAIYYKQGNYKKTEETYLKSLELREKIGGKNGVSRSQTNLGRFYLNTNKVESALKHALIGYQLTLELEYPELISDATLLMSDIYYEKKEFKKSHDYLLVHIEMKDSVLNDRTQKGAVKQQIEYEFEKEKIENDAAHEKQLAISLEQEKQQQLIIYAVVGSLILVILFSIIIFNRLRITRKQKLIIEDQKVVVEQAHLELEEKNTEILDSIHYAERIQRSFLATDELLNNNLKDYFVFFQPKDVVSGDFYWAGKLVNNNFAMVNADSTGHGVPGAIMSILNISSIEKAIDEKFIKPSEIFNHTRDTIIERLSKDGSEEGGKDGMDASIIIFDFESSKFSYAAAQNPIWIIRAGELIEIKGEKMPIGKHQNDSVPFVGGEFETQKDDVIYTVTDGFQDQFGGEKGKKFMVKPFKNFLISIAHLPMQEQLEKLSETFITWRGDEEQVDDVCVIGVRV
jgi:serine phosphatase RsbU (regulator of sigma subunit)/Flp pilus assembly protein TadD